MIRIHDRQSGETTYLIKRSSVTKYPIVVATIDQKYDIMNLSKKMLLSIPEPLTILDIVNDRERGKRFEKVIINNADQVLDMIIFTKLVASTDVISFDSSRIEQLKPKSLFSRIIDKIFKRI